MLVYDLGGGTFDVTYLEKQDDRFLVKSTKGDNQLGGMDFDDLLLEKVIDKFNRESGIDISSDLILIQQLKDQVERAKIELSARDTALIALPFIGGNGKPIHLSYNVTRSEFSGLIKDHIQRTITLSLEALSDAGVKAAEIESLILSGGSSRIPFVKTMLAQVLSLEPERRINPEEVVAAGAAIQAALVAGTIDDIVLKDVTPFSLGVEIEGGEFIRILNKNTQIPAQRRKIFTTISDNQRSVEIHVLQGEQKKAKDNTSLGRFLLTGIRESKKGMPQIAVLFSVDADGILHVLAKDLDTGVGQQITINSSMDEDLIVDSLNAVVKAKNRVTLLIERVNSLMEKTGKIIDTGFRKEIDDIIRKSRKAILKKDMRTLKECQIALETVIGEITTLQTYEEEIKYGQA
ncbi:MAG: Hsp70 family protein [Spirochaetota bacterium]